MGILLENVAVRNDALQMTQNLAEPVSRLSSRTGRVPWLFPSLNLDRSHSELATPWVPVEILYASSRDRICLFRGRKEGRSRRQRLQDPGTVSRKIAGDTPAATEATALQSKHCAAAL
jgi:hypothetical protein